MLSPKSQLLLYITSISLLLFSPLTARIIPKQNKLPLEKKHFPLELFAYYTLWQPYQEGLSIAYSAGDRVEMGNILRPQSRLRSGFIAGGKWNTPHDNWTISTKYTWFYNFPSLKEERLKTILPYKSPFSEDDLDSDFIESKFNNQFNSLVATFERPFFVGDFFELRPCAGLIGAWDKQSLFFIMKIDDETDQREYQFHQNWWGLGPYGKIECNFYLIQHFSFFLKTGIGLLKATHDVTQYISDYNDEGTEIGEPEENSSTYFCNIEPMFEGIVGIKCFLELTKQSLELELAWQVQTYLSHNGFQAFYSPVGMYGSYSMEGLTVGLLYSF